MCIVQFLFFLFSCGEIATRQLQAFRGKNTNLKVLAKAEPGLLNISKKQACPMYFYIWVVWKSELFFSPKLLLFHEKGLLRSFRFL